MAVRVIAQSIFKPSSPEFAAAWLFLMTDGTMWPAATGREKDNAAAVSGPVLTGPFDSAATWAAFVDTGTGTPSVTGYAQQLPAISRLALGHIEAAGSQVLIRFGREPVVLPEPLDTLVLSIPS